jgi:Family of unknown function (DUF5681)
MFLKTTSQLISITENGRLRKVPKLEAMAIQLVNKAVSGDSKAIGQIFQLVQIFEGVPDRTSTENPDTEKNLAAMKGLAQRLMGNKEGGDLK